MTQDAVPDLSAAALDALELRLQTSGPIGIAPLDTIRALRAERTKMLAVIEAAKQMRKQSFQRNAEHAFDAALAALEEA